MTVRVLASIARGFAVVAATWLLAMALVAQLPGDAARALAGPQAGHADVARLRAKLALDAPLPSRVAARIRATVHRPVGAAARHAECVDLRVVHVDLGRSYVYRRPVAELVAKRLPATIALATASAALTMALGIAIGFAARSARGAHLVRASRFVSSLPAYAVGIALHELFARRLAWLPIESAIATPSEALASAVLPVVTLTLAMVGPYAALARERWAAIAREPFVTAAIARGATPRGAVWRHGLRHVAGALAALVCVDAGALVGGSVLTERLFRWPGLGSLAIEALLSRDVPTLEGVVLVAAAAVAFASTLGEIARGLADPRVRR